MKKTYLLSEGLLFCGVYTDFVHEFTDEELVVYRLSLNEWIVYKPTTAPCYKLTVLPDDDGGYGERYMVNPDAVVVPVKGWGVWDGKSFVSVFVPYRPNLTLQQVWIRLSPDDLDFYEEAQKEVSVCRHKHFA